RCDTALTTPNLSGSYLLRKRRCRIQDSASSKQLEADVLKSHYCGELRIEHAGQDVSLAGWVHRRRDHGGLIFLDLRDSTGLLQVVVNPQNAAAAHAAASEVRNEYVIQVKGEVMARRPGTENDSMATG